MRLHGGGTAADSEHPGARRKSAEAHEGNRTLDLFFTKEALLFTLKTGDLL